MSRNLDFVVLREMKPAGKSPNSGVTIAMQALPSLFFFFFFYAVTGALGVNFTHELRGSFSM